MASLVKRSRRCGLALAIALGLTVLSAVGTPLLSSKLVHLLPGPDVALADEPHDGSG